MSKHLQRDLEQLKKQLLEEESMVEEAVNKAITALTERRPEVESYSATEAKNAFGQLLDRTIAGGMVAITRHHEPRAVLLSIDEYETLMARVEDPIARPSPAQAVPPGHNEHIMAGLDRYTDQDQPCATPCPE